MKPRDFLNFFKTKSGKIVVFGALFAGALMILSVVRKHHTSAEDAIKVTTLATNVTDKPQVVQSVTRPMQVFSPPPEKSQPVIYSPSSRPAFQNSSALPTPAADHQPVRRQFGGKSSGQKVEHGVRAVRKADSL